MTNTTTHGQVPDSIRVPLDSLHADAEYLLARLLAGTLTREQVVGVIRDRIDAARLEIEALHARVQELGAMLRENRSKRIVALETENLGLLHALAAEQDANTDLRQQLEAIGAGGVEPLRKRPRQIEHDHFRGVTKMVTAQSAPAAVAGPAAPTAQAAPPQEAQEPVAWQGVHDQTDLYYTKPLQADVRPLYAAPQPAPVAQGDALDVEIAALESSCAHLGRLIDELRPDAERYQYLRERDLDTIRQGGVFAGRTPDNVVLNGDDLDAAIDAARAQAKEGEIHE